MKTRINVFEIAPKALRALNGMASYIYTSSIERHLLHLVSFRMAQINGCAYCLDMHSKDLRAEGEIEQRLYMLDAWRESPVYSDRERAAFAWAEAVNDLSDGRVSDEVYNEALSEFTETELVDLTMAVLATSNYNRINVAFRTPAGSYTVGQHAVSSN